MHTDSLSQEPTGEPVSAANESSGGDAEPDTAISLLDILIVLTKRKRVILLVTLVFALMAALVSLLLPKKYTALATILPPPPNTSLGQSALSQLGALSSISSGGLNLKNPNDVYVAMFRCRTVEDAIVQQFDLQHKYHERILSDAREAFEAHSSVDGAGKDTLIHISVEDQDPVVAAAMANGYVEQFRKLNQGLAFTEAAQRRLFFEQQLNKAKDDLARAEGEFMQTEGTTGLIELGSQTRALIQSAAALRAQATAKQVEIDSMRTFATNENSQLVQAQVELKSLQEQLAKLGGAGESGESGTIVPKGGVPEADMEYARKMRDVKYNETLLEMMARQYEIAKVDEAKQGSIIQVVDVAQPPDKRSSPRRGLIVMVSSGVGFLFGILLALILEGLQPLRRDSETARKLAMLRQLL